MFRYFSRNRPKCHDHVGKNPNKANKVLLEILRNDVILKKDDISNNKSIFSRLEVFLDDVTKEDPTFPLCKKDKDIIRTGLLSGS